MYRIRDWLFVGKYSQTRQLNLLNEVGITAMLQLADHIPQPDIESLYLDVSDGETLPRNMIERGVGFVRSQKKQGKKVLVACGAGISRSSTFAIAALMEEEDLAIFDAYYEVFLRYRGAQPHPELIMSLSAYHGYEMDLLEAWEGLHAVREAIQGRAGV